MIQVQEKDLFIMFTFITFKLNYFLEPLTKILHFDPIYIVVKNFLFYLVNNFLDQQCTIIYFK